jgi:hypothetical protein
VNTQQVPVSAWDATPESAPNIKTAPTALNRAGNAAAGFNYGAIPGTVGLPVDTALNVWDLAKAAAGATYGAITGKVPPSAFDPSDRSQYVGSSSWIAHQIRKAPYGTYLIDNQNPEDKASRLLYAGGTAAGGAATSSLAPVPGPFVPQSDMQFARQIGATLLGSELSGAGSQAAYERTGDPAIATLVGFTPVLAQKAGETVLRGAMRGGEQGRQQMQRNIDTANQAGTTLTVGQASQSAVPQLAEALLSKMPGGYGVFRDKGMQQQEDLQATIDALTAGQPNDPTQSGRAIQTGIRSNDADNPGFYERFKTGQNNLYTRLDQYLPPTTAVPVTGTRDALVNLTTPISGAPNTSQRFINGDIQSIKNGFDLDTGLVRPSGTNATAVSFGPQEAPPQPSLRTVTVPWSAPPAPVRRNGEGVAPASARGPSGTVTRTIQVGKTPPQQPPSGSVTRVISTAPVVPGEGTWRPPQTPALPYQAVKQLRTQVGDAMSTNSLTSSVPNSQWKALYAGLSGDMQGAAEAAGPQATQAWNRANNYTAAGINRLEQLQPFANAATPEQAFERLVNSASHGPTQINAVKRSLAPDQWKQVVSNVIDQLGDATPGQQNANGDAFSPETFLTNWNKMDPSAKTALVGGFDGADEMRAKLDALAQTTGNLRSSAKVLANPSGTAPVLNARDMLIGGLAAGAYNPWALIGVPATLGGVNLASRAMTNPDIVQALARKTMIDAPTQRSYAGRLATMLLSGNDSQQH